MYKKSHLEAKHTSHKPYKLVMIGHNRNIDKLRTDLIKYQLINPHMKRNSMSLVNVLVRVSLL